MSCGPLTAAFDYECDDSIGGIKQATILVAQFTSITASTVTAGEITSLTQSAGTKFYRYKAKKFIAGAITTETHDPLTGTTVYDTVLQTMLNKLSKTKNVELQLLVSKPTVVIYQDNEDTWHCIGLSNGAEKMGGTNGSQTGTAAADQNGYQIAWTATEKQYPYTVDATVVAGLSIVGSAS